MGHDPYKDQQDEENARLRSARDAHANRTIQLSVAIGEKQNLLAELKREIRSLRDALDAHQEKWPSGR